MAVRRILFLFTLTLLVASWTHGLQPIPTVITNFDGGGTAIANQVTTYDVEGNAVDAFQGGVQSFNGTFYWYGMGMGCGYIFSFGTPWCGFNVYSSPDLINWTYKGKLFDPSAWQTKCGTFSVNGCWEPHGSYNASTGLYVFWFLTEGSTGTNNTYFVVTCTTPYSGCTQATNPTLALGGGGDMNLFTDPNTSIAYLIHGHSPGGPAVDQLTSNYTNGAGSGVSVSTSVNEGYAMYYNNGTYYASASPSTFGNAITYYFTSSTPLGTYTLGATAVSLNSCGGQQTAVYPFPEGSTTLFFQSELWNSGAMNQGLANHYFGPIAFAGTVPSVTCTATVPVSGVTTYGRQTAYAAGADQSDETSMLFRSICDITGTKYRMQTFVPSRNGSISKVQLPLAQNVLASVCFYGASGNACDGPDGNLTVSVVTLDGSNNPLSTLWSQSIVGSTLSWTPRETSLSVTGANVTGGTAYGLKVSGSNTKACYSVGYARTLQYAAGIERVSSDSGSTWTTDTGASLKFSVFLQ